MNYDIELGQIRVNLQGLSKQVFGKLYRLEVVAIVGAQDPPIWSRRVAKTLGLADNQVAGELSSFVEIGALLHFPSEHDRRRIYQVARHPIWAFGRALLEETIRAEDPVNGEERKAAYWATVLEGAAPRPVPG